MIEVLALQALLDDALGDETAALQTLQQAVEPGGAWRPPACLCRPGPKNGRPAHPPAQAGKCRSQFTGQILQAFTAADLQWSDFVPATTSVANQADSYRAIDRP